MMRFLRSFGLVAVLLGLLGLLGCATPPDVGDPAEVLAGPGDMFGVAWLSSDNIYVGHTIVVDDVREYRVGVVEPDGSIRALPAPDVSGCHVQRALEPFGLPDGRLGFLHACEGAPGQVTRSSIVAMDPATEALEILTTYQSRASNAGAIAPNPAADTFWKSDGGGPCATIIEITAGSATPPPITISDGRSFRLDDGPDPVEDCLRTGRAGFPTWSPDGSLIGFFASTAAIGRSGGARLEAPWGLYRLEVGSTAPELLLSGVVHPRALHFSPDGDEFIFSGIVNGRPGTWLVGADGDGLRRISPTRYSWIAWSPDGAAIAGLHLVDETTFPLSMTLERLTIPVAPPRR